MPLDTFIPLAGGLLIAFTFRDELCAAGERMGERVGDVHRNCYLRRSAVKKTLITELTRNQERELIEFRERMWRQGTACAPADRFTAQAAIIEAYAVVKRPPPKFFWMPSPMTCALALYVRFGSMIGCPQRTDLLQRLDIMERIAASCGFWYPRDGICIISDRFAGTSWDGSRNRQGMPFRLHKNDGPAISFRDGWGVYYWHGLRIPPSHEWIIAEKRRLSFETIAKEPNAELRRVMFEIALESDPEIVTRDAKLVSEDEAHGQPRRLLEAIVGGQPVRILEVVNGSVEPDGRRRKFHLGAMAGNTPHECVAASYGRNPERYREADRT